MRNYSNKKNKHLCFVFIPKYKCLENTSLCFDDRYVFDFDRTNDVLTIKENKNHIDHLWGKSIYSLSAIVGKNGAGKSTAISYVMETLVEGCPKDVAEGVFVVEEDGKLFVHTNKKLEIVRGDNISAEWKDGSVSIETFFYTSHFSVPFSGTEIKGVQLSGMYNGSDYYSLVGDVVNYCNANSFGLQQPMQNHLIGYNSQNTYRIALLIAQYYDTLLEFELEPPKYVIIAPNTSGLFKIKSKSIKNPDNIEPPAESLSPVSYCNLSEEKKNLYRFVYHIILNLATNEAEIDTKIVLRLREWLENFVGQSPSDEDFDVSIKILLQNLEIDDDFKEAIFNILPCIESLCEVSEYGDFYIDISKNIKHLLELIAFSAKYRIFITARFFDIVYTHNVDMNDSTMLSSGEQEMLNLYSRIYDAVLPEQLHPEKNTPKPSLFILDEAEIGYHPEWQRKFVNNIVKFMNLLGKEENFFQVILTSHSPIILSDVPKSCTNYLTKGRPKPQEETFGSNVFDLYRSSFFLHDGLIGEFATNKINEVLKTIDKIECGEHNINSDGSIKGLDEAKKIIISVGDNRIREYLLARLYKIDPLYVIKYYRRNERGDIKHQ